MGTYHTAHTFYGVKVPMQTPGGEPWYEVELPQDIQYLELGDMRGDEMQGYLTRSRWLVSTRVNEETNPGIEVPCELVHTAFASEEHASMLGIDMTPAAWYFGVYSG